jgi:hypothetical protein
MWAAILKRVAAFILPAGRQYPKARKGVKKSQYPSSVALRRAVQVKQ